MILDKIRTLIWDDNFDSSYQKLAGTFFIHTAIDSGDMKLVEHILKTTGYIDAPNEDGYSPLHLAAFNGDVDMVRLLFMYGADANIACVNTYETPLHFAAYHGNSKLFMIFVNHGANVNLEDRHRVTPLEQLLKSNHEAVFIDIIEQLHAMKDKICNKTLMNCYQRAIRYDFAEAKDLLKKLLLVQY